MDKALELNIKYYNTIEADLKPGIWVLIFNSQLINTYSTFDEAAKEAVKKFGSGPYLIRQTGASPVVLPTSFMYRIKPDA